MRPIERRLAALEARVTRETGDTNVPLYVVPADADQEAFMTRRCEEASRDDCVFIISVSPSAEIKR